MEASRQKLVILALVVSVGIGLACLLASPFAAQDGGVDALAKRLTALQREFRQAERAIGQAYDEAKTPAEQARALAIDPWAPVQPRVEALAFEAEGTEVAAGAWTMILDNEFLYGDRERGWEAFGILIHDHTDSPELQRVAERMTGFGRDDPRTFEGLQHLVEMSSNRSVQGTALFSLATMLAVDAGTRPQAFDYYRRIISDYAEVKGSRGLLAKRAEGALFEAEHLQVGMAVPDISATDETGTDFRLSDYRGRVVLVEDCGREAVGHPAGGGAQEVAASR